MIQSTSFWEEITKDELIPNKVQTVDDIKTPPQILGDGAFPLGSWLMKVYGEVGLYQTKDISTTILSETVWFQIVPSLPAKMKILLILAKNS